MEETIRLIVGICASEVMIITVSAFVTGLMIPRKNYINREIPDWLLEKYSKKYGQPTFLILNAILSVYLLWRVFNVELV